MYRPSGPFGRRWGLPVSGLRGHSQRPAMTSRSLSPARKRVADGRAVCPPARLVRGKRLVVGAGGDGLVWRGGLLVEFPQRSLQPLSLDIEVSARLGSRFYRLVRDKPTPSLLTVTVSAVRCCGRSICFRLGCSPWRTAWPGMVGWKDANTCPMDSASMISPALGWRV